MYFRVSYIIRGYWNGQSRPKIRLKSIVKHNIAQKVQIVQKKQYKRSKSNIRTNKTKI